jgi:GxxExxY protein
VLGIIDREKRRVGEVITDPLSKRIIGAAIKVHRALGPGLLESTYSRCLTFELAHDELVVEVEKPVPIFTAISK